MTKRQQKGFGAMLGFELARIAAVRAFVDAIRIFTFAESLGGVESLVAPPGLGDPRRDEVGARATAGYQKDC